MTDRERIDVIAYVRERFDAQDTTLADIVERLESLETDRDERIGARNTVALIFKTSMALIAAAAASIGAFLGVTHH